MTVYPPRDWQRTKIPQGMRGVTSAYRVMKDIPGLYCAGDVVCCTPPPLSVAYLQGLKIKYILKGE